MDQLREWQEDARRAIERKIERLDEEKEMLMNYLHFFEFANKEIAAKEEFRQQMEEEKESRKEIEMKYLEMSKLSANVVKKSPQEDLHKALRTFINKSKQKRIEKRIAIKEMVLELGNVNGIVFPDDIAATIDSLDDENPEPKVVHVAGNYNDVHDNENINCK